MERERGHGCTVADERAPLWRVWEAPVLAVRARLVAVSVPLCVGHSLSGRRNSRGCSAAAAETHLHLERLDALLELHDARLQPHDAQPALLQRRERQRGRHRRGRLPGRALGLRKLPLAPQRVRSVLKVPRVKVLQNRVVSVVGVVVLRVFCHSCTGVC